MPRATGGRALPAGRALAAPRPGARSTDLEARLQGVHVDLHHGNKERAKATIAALRRERPNDPTVLLTAAMLYRLDGLYDRAAAEYDHLLALNPGDAVLVSYNKARLAMNQGDNDRAVAELEAGRAAEPEHPLLKMFLAIARFQQGRIDEAQSLIEDVLRQSPQFDAAQPLLAWCLAARGRARRGARAHHRPRARDREGRSRGRVLARLLLRRAGPEGRGHGLAAPLRLPRQRGLRAVRGTAARWTPCATIRRSRSWWAELKRALGAAHRRRVAAPRRDRSQGAAGADPAPSRGELHGHRRGGGRHAGRRRGRPPEPAHARRGRHRPHHASRAARGRGLRPAHAEPPQPRSWRTSTPARAAQILEGMSADERTDIVRQHGGARAPQAPAPEAARACGPRWSGCCSTPTIGGRDHDHGVRPPRARHDGGRALKHIRAVAREQGVDLRLLRAGAGHGPAAGLALPARPRDGRDGAAGRPR